MRVLFALRQGTGEALPMKYRAHPAFLASDWSFTSGRTAHTGSLHRFTRSVEVQEVYRHQNGFLIFAANVLSRELRAKVWLGATQRAVYLL